MFLIRLARPTPVIRKAARKVFAATGPTAGGCIYLRGAESCVPWLEGTRCAWECVWRGDQSEAPMLARGRC